MSLSPLIPIATAAAGSIATGAADLIGDGLSFAGTLIDDVSKRIQSIAADDPPFVSINDREAALKSLHRATQDSLERLRGILTQKLSSAGIHTDAPIELRSDGLGSVQAVDDHPQRAAIERLLNEDRSLATLFNHLTSQQAFLESLETGEDVDPMEISIRLENDEIDVLIASKEEYETP